nr:hypothetical protein [Tanacetum cinerariifolium]
YVVPTGRVVVPTGRVIVPTGRVVVPTGRVIVTGRVVVPTGRVIVPTGRVVVLTGRVIVPTALGWHLKEIHVTWAHLGKNGRNYNSTPKSKKNKHTDSRDALQIIATALEVLKDGAGIIVTAPGLF